MISAIDTSVLLDVITDDPARAETSQKLLERAYDEGILVISDVTYAELAPQFDARQDLDAVLERFEIELVDGGADVAHLAGRKWAEYKKGAAGPARFLADFMIGAHAQLRADRLLTRDRGFYRSYFPELRLLEA